ncbi:poly(A)-specific ribonuclease, partial [Coelomomyces lativittatus]
MTYQRFHQGILVLTSDYVKLLHRRGLQGFSIPAYASPRKPFLAMTYASNRPTHELVVSTHAPSLEIIHIHRGERMPSLNIDLPSVSPVQCMRGVDTHTFLTAHAQGTLSLIDARTWKSVGSMAVHSGGFSDVLVYDPCTVYTSGLTSSITVLDLRMLARCGYVPLYQPHRFSRWDPFVIALSETQVHWLQASTYQCTQTFLLDTWATSLDVSMSHDFIALGDAQGHLHVVSTTMPPTPPSHSTHPATTSTTTTTAPATRTTTNSHTPPPSFHSVNPSSSSSPSSPCVNVMSEPVALPSYIYPMPKIPFHPQVPLNLLGVPPCTSYLSGETWPTSLPRSTHLLTAPLDPSFLMHAKWTSGGAIGFVPKPPHALRQRWPYTTKEVLPTHLFKSTLQHHSHSKKKMSPKAYDTTTPTPTSTTAASLPRTSCVMEDYKKMSIQYSKFGVHDFNFHFFNPTTWSGLETDVEHMYVNNYLQTLHFSTPLNRLAMTHAYTICEKETCLLCETGFLFRTLQQAKGLNCRTTHWSYVFGQLPDTDVLNLREHPNVPFPSLAITLQHCARYLMDLFHKESDQGCQEYLTRIETLATCSQCRQTQEKPANVFLIDLNYPGRRSNFLDTSFVDILKDSLISSSSNRGWCDHCKQYITLCKRKSVIQFPTVIQLACHVKSDWNTDWWCSQETTFLNTSIPPFLPEKIWLSIHHGEVHCKLPNDDDEEKEDDVYTLTAVTCEVTDAEPHIISHIRIRDDEWYLFNDFRVRQVPATHVFQFPKWK